MRFYIAAVTIAVLVQSTHVSCAGTLQRQTSQAEKIRPELKLDKSPPAFTVDVSSWIYTIELYFSASRLTDN